MLFRCSTGSPSCMALLTFVKPVPGSQIFAKVKSTRKVSSRFIFKQSSLCKMNRYSLNTMMTFSYDNKGFLLLGNKTCDSHCNIKNVSTILFNMDHSPLVLCLSSCVFCWFRDELGTMQKVEIKPHQMAPGQTT